MDKSHKKVYFASDFHLGADAKRTSSEREILIVSWMKSIELDCEVLFLVGDIFDYWFEYKNVVPKGYTRLFSQLRSMVDNGIDIHFFVGNHDMWVKDYFTLELGINVYYHPKVFDLKGKKFYIGHGDGLGPGDHKYKIIKKILRSPFLQWCYGWIHPTIGLPLMKSFSHKSRIGQDEEPISQIKEEWLVQFAESHRKTTHIDYYIFGHRHLPIDYTLTDNKSRYLNLGDWLEFCSYGVWDGQEMSVMFYKNNKNHEVYTFA